MQRKELQEWRLSTKHTVGNNKSRHDGSVSAAVAKQISTLGLKKPENESPTSKDALKALIMSALSDDSKANHAPNVAAVVATLDFNKNHFTAIAPSITLAQLLK